MKPRAASLFLCGTLCITALFPAAVSTRDQDEDRLVRLYEHLAPAAIFLSVVYESIHPVSHPQKTGVGAGFLIDETGTVLTNAHVVDGAGSILATLFDGTSIKAKLLALDPTTDVAILQIASVERKFVPVKLGDSTHLRVGQSSFTPDEELFMFSSRRIHIGTLQFT